MTGPARSAPGWHACPQRRRCPGIRVRISDLQYRRKRQCFLGQHSSEGASVFSHGWSGDRIAVGAQPVVSVFSSGLALKGRHNCRTALPCKASMRSRAAADRRRNRRCVCADSPARMPAMFPTSCMPCKRSCGRSSASFPASAGNSPEFTVSPAASRRT